MENDETIVVRLENPVGALVSCGRVGEPCIRPVVRGRPGRDPVTDMVETVNSTSDEDVSAVKLRLVDARGTLVNDDALVFGFELTGVSVDEENTETVQVVFTVDMGGTSDREVTVRYATADGTATAGSDYTASSGTLTFAAGERRKTFTAGVLGDLATEGDETFMVSLSDASGSGATLSTTAGTATVTIRDGNNVNSGPSIGHIPNRGSEVGKGIFLTVPMRASDPEGDTLHYWAELVAVPVDFQDAFAISPAVRTQRQCLPPTAQEALRLRH